MTETLSARRGSERNRVAGANPKTGVGPADQRSLIRHSGPAVPRRPSSAPVTLPTISRSAVGCHGTARRSSSKSTQLWPVTCRCEQNRPRDFEDDGHPRSRRRPAPRTRPSGMGPNDRRCHTRDVQPGRLAVVVLATEFAGHGIRRFAGCNSVVECQRWEKALLTAYQSRTYRIWLAVSWRCFRKPLVC